MNAEEEWRPVTLALSYFRMTPFPDQEVAQDHVEGWEGVAAFKGEETRNSFKRRKMKQNRLQWVYCASSRNGTVITRA